jgi:hypothetical protein
LRTVRAAPGRIWVHALVISVVIAAAWLWSSEESPLAMHAAATATPSATSSPSATATPSPTETATPTTTPTPTSTPLRDRENCDEVRGTEYRSSKERYWFQVSCVTPTVPPPATPVPEVAAVAVPSPTAEPPALSTSLEELVCSYGWDCSWALGVMYCESGGNPNAYNPAGPYICLFQLHQSHGSNLLDPATNVAVAYSVFLSSGPSSWGACA